MSLQALWIALVVQIAFPPIPVPPGAILAREKREGGKTTRQYEVEMPFERVADWYIARYGKPDGDWGDPKFWVFAKDDKRARAIWQWGKRADPARPDLYPNTRITLRKRNDQVPIPKGPQDTRQRYRYVRFPDWTTIGLQIEWLPRNDLKVSKHRFLRLTANASFERPRGHIDLFPNGEGHIQSGGNSTQGCRWWAEGDPPKAGKPGRVRRIHITQEMGETVVTVEGSPPNMDKVERIFVAEGKSRITWTRRRF